MSGLVPFKLVDCHQRPNQPVVLPMVQVSFSAP